MSYAIFNPERGEAAIIRISDGASIPISEQNRDYLIYLEWLAEGNTPGEWSEE
jgi:hypothetical protein